MQMTSAQLFNPQLTNVQRWPSLFEGLENKNKLGTFAEKQGGLGSRAHQNGNKPSNLSDNGRNPQASSRQHIGQDDWNDQQKNPQNVSRNQPKQVRWIDLATHKRLATSSRGGLPFHNQSPSVVSHHKAMFPSSLFKTCRKPPYQIARQLGRIINHLATHPTAIRLSTSTNPKPVRPYYI